MHSKFSSVYTKKTFINSSTQLHIRIKLILHVCGAVTFALECANALKTAGDNTLVGPAFAENFDKSRFLHLLFKAALEPFIGFVAFFDCVNSHKAGV